MSVACAIPLKPKKPAPVREPDYEGDFKIARDKLYARFDCRTDQVYEGRNRRVYVLRGYVVKIPRNFDGMADNDWEGSIRNGERPLREWQVVYPKTRLVYIYDVPVVLMEIVRPVTTRLIKRVRGSIPKWIDCVDCGQVGFTKDGRLVAYDYGCR